MDPPIIYLYSDASFRDTDPNSGEIAGVGSSRLNDDVVPGPNELSTPRVEDAARCSSEPSGEARGGVEDGPNIDNGSSGPVFAERFDPPTEENIEEGNRLNLSQDDEEITEPENHPMATRGEGANEEEFEDREIGPFCRKLLDDSDTPGPTCVGALGKPQNEITEPQNGAMPTRGAGTNGKEFEDREIGPFSRKLLDDSDTPGPTCVGALGKPQNEITELQSGAMPTQRAGTNGKEFEIEMIDNDTPAPTRVGALDEPQKEITEPQNNTKTTRGAATNGEEFEDPEIQSFCRKLLDDSDTPGPTCVGAINKPQNTSSTPSVTIAQQSEAAEQQCLGQLSPEKSRLLIQRMVGNDAEGEVTYTVKFVNSKNGTEEGAAACWSAEVSKSDSNLGDDVDSKSGASVKKASTSTAMDRDDIMRCIEVIGENYVSHFRSRIREKYPEVNFDVENAKTNNPLQKDLHLVFKYLKERKKRKNSKENRGSGNELAELDMAALSISPKCEDLSAEQPVIDKQSTKNPQVESESGTNIKGAKVGKHSEESKEFFSKNSEQPSSGLEPNPEESSVNGGRCISEKASGSTASDPEKSAKDCASNVEVLRASSFPNKGFHETPTNDVTSLYNPARNGARGNEKPVCSEDGGSDPKEDYALSYKTFPSAISNPGPGKSEPSEFRKPEIPGNAVARHPVIRPIPSIPAPPPMSDYSRDHYTLWNQSNFGAYRNGEADRGASVNGARQQQSEGSRPDGPPSVPTQQEEGSRPNVAPPVQRQQEEGSRPNAGAPSVPRQQQEDSRPNAGAPSVPRQQQEDYRPNAGAPSVPRQQQEDSRPNAGAPSVPRQQVEGSTPNATLFVPRPGTVLEGSRPLLDFMNDQDAAFVWDLYRYVNGRRKNLVKQFTKSPLSPMSPRMQDCVRVMLEAKEREMHFVAVQYSMSPPSVAAEAVEHFVLRPFCPKTFLWLFVYLCNHFLLGHRDAFTLPASLGILVGGIRALRERGEFGDDTWRHVEAAAKSIAASLIRSYMGLRFTRVPT